MTTNTNITNAEVQQPDTSAGDVDHQPDNITKDLDQNGTPDNEQEQEPDNGNAEAAKWRRKLRDTEAERDALTEQLTAQHRAIIDWRATNAARGAVDPQLLDAAGIDITTLLDDNGHLDMTAVDTFIDNTATKFRVHRTIKPNPQQGNPSAARTATTMADVFRDDQKRKN